MKRRETYQRKGANPVEVIGWLVFAVVMTYAVVVNMAY